MSNNTELIAVTHEWLETGGINPADAQVIRKLLAALEASDMSQVVPQPNREAVRSAVGNVLCNVMNFPENVQARLLGQNMGPLNDKITDAVLAALSPAPLSINREALKAVITATIDGRDPARALPNDEFDGRIADAVIKFLSAQTVGDEVEWEYAAERLDAYGVVVERRDEMPDNPDILGEWRSVHRIIGPWTEVQP